MCVCVCDVCDHKLQHYLMNSRWYIDLFHAFSPKGWKQPICPLASESQSLQEKPVPKEIKCHILYTAHLAVKLDFFFPLCC